MKSRLEGPLTELGHLDAPASLMDGVMARVGERAFLGFSLRHWTWTGVCLGAWALTVLGLVRWSTSQLLG